MAQPIAVDWYFDIISPFSYLQLHALDDLPAHVTLTPRPVVFGAILAHWGQRGPAEIDGKRLNTYRMCQWAADRRGIAFRFPPRHPFNPLPALRLITALGADRATVRRAFDFVFAEGRAPDTEDAIAALAERLGAREPAAALIADPAVKDALRRSTDAAIARGVYGVPTLAAGEEMFWGDDATGLFRDWLADPGLFRRGEMARLATIEVGARRR